jgi:hypothetical protein
MQNVHRIYRRLGFSGALVIGLLGAHRGAAAAPVPDRAWGTYVGGVGDDYVSDLAVDSAGNVYVAGRTSSPDGIATVGAFRATPSAYDAFLIKYDPAGTRVWGTYYGGGLDDWISGIAATDARVVIVGHTDSDDGIATPGAHQSNKGKYGDGFIATFSVDGALVMMMGSTRRRSLREVTSSSAAGRGVSMASPHRARFRRSLRGTRTCFWPASHRRGRGSGAHTSAAAPPR